MGVTGQEREEERREMKRASGRCRENKKRMRGNEKWRKLGRSEGKQRKMSRGMLELNLFIQ